MTDAYQVIIDIDEIARLNEQLTNKLRNVFRHKEARSIGNRKKRVVRDIFFEARSGQDVRAWSPFEEDGKWENALITGNPGASTPLGINVLINFPVVRYDRFLGGIFVKDRFDNIFIAHRGRLTKGSGGLTISSVLTEFAAQTVRARDNKGDDTVILIAALNSSDLIDRLWQFAGQARAAATRLASARSQRKPIEGATQAANKGPMIKLVDYFDEFAGERYDRGHGGGARIVEHGDIVRALYDQLALPDQARKSQAIDLALVTDKVVHLYEVKTSDDMTSLYTGVGQLILHGEAIRQLLSRDVKRNLVLPNTQRTEEKAKTLGRLDIGVITFTKAKGSYVFSRLP